MKTLIYIFCGGPSSEFDISLLSAKEILKRISKKKYDIALFYISPLSTVTIVKLAETERLSNESIEALFVSIQKKSGVKLSQAFTSVESALDSISKNPKQEIFALISPMHGEFGEDGSLQRLLDNRSIPYCGSGRESSKLVWDKLKAAIKVAVLDNVYIPKTEIITSKTLDSWKSFPAIIKPNKKGSSVGVFIINSATEISLPENQDYLIQEFIQSIEVSAGALQRSDGSFVLIPPIEIIPRTSDFFDYKSKYEPGESLETTPPKNIDTKLSHEISQLACDIHNILGCRVYSRSDFIVRGNNIYYLETNTLPGFTSNSLFPKEARAANISFEELIEFIIIESLPDKK
ncbi:MAG: ATP-grasp domain-containing protein [Candidatus Paceibacterota bacterium]